MKHTALVVCLTVFTQTIEWRTSALVPEDSTTPGVNPRSSINKATLPDPPASLDMGAVLCEKYSEWTMWSPCSRKCEQVRVRRCRKPEDCGRSVVKEKRTCTRSRGVCGPVSFKAYKSRRDFQGMSRKWPRKRFFPHLTSGTVQEPNSTSLRSAAVIGMKKRNRMIKEFVQLLYGHWSAWGPCTRQCRQKRMRKCKKQGVCVRSIVQEERRCIVPGTKCEHRYSLKPLGFSQDFSDNSKENEYEITFENADADRTTRYGKRRNLKRLGNELVTAQKQCGLRPRNSSRSYRVVGGQEVMRNSWPWQVAITTRQKEQYCGGTLIAPRWVLTAAHCVRKKGKRRRLELRVGEHDIGGYDASEETIRPEKEFPHPDFNYQTITNDIALIKLRKPPSAFTETSYACLPSEDFQPARNQLCYIVGWGKLKNTHIFGSDSLMEAQVPVVRHKRCQRVFEYDITQNQVCAGYKRGGIDSCAGDSGGPLLCSETHNRTDRFFLYGVTSYGEGCGRKGKYGIYTKVSSYIKWIEDTIIKNR